MSRNGYARRALFNAGHKFCAYCSLELTIEVDKSNTLSVDHKVPRAKGGKTRKQNIASSCIPCNVRKGDLLLLPVYCTLTGKPLPWEKV